MNKREASFATKFSRWYKYRWPDDIGAYFEFKVSVNNSLPFSAVSEKQYNNLQIKKFYHKFSDFSRLGTPFDAVGFCGQGYVVIQYNYPCKEFIVIKIESWLNEKETSTRRSLTEYRAKEIGTVYSLG